GVAISEIDAPLRRDDADPQALVLAGMLRSDAVRDRARQDRPPAEARIARVGVEKAALNRPRLAAPEGGDGASGALVGDRDLRAQLIETKPFGEIGRLRRAAIDEKDRSAGVRSAHDDHVEQDLALRR